YLQSSRIAELCEPLSPATEATKKGLAETNLGSARVGTGLSPVQAELRSAAPGAACPGWYINREPFLDVIRMHRASVNNINKNNVPSSLYEASKSCWDESLAHGEKFGYRNSQVTVLAPTGTIGFMMDCATTGIEPDLALVKFKKLVGGGMIKIVNQTVPTALFKLGYSAEQVNNIVSYIDATGTIEGAPGLKDEHLACFDCSFKPSKGTRSIHYMGHIRMMAAADRRSRNRSWRPAESRTRPRARRPRPHRQWFKKKSPRVRRRQSASVWQTSASASPTSSPSPDTMAISPSVSTKTGNRARSSS